jgi:hypothetical protein
VSAADPTRLASRATLPARGRDWSPLSGAFSAMLMQLRDCSVDDDADAVPSLPFMGRVAREAGRVGF